MVLPHGELDSTVRFLGSISIRKGVSKMDWRPIETAPKDGTEVLLYFEKGFTEKGRWVDRETREYGKVTHRIEKWSWGSGVFGSLLGNEPEPTHWMPIPSGPVGFV